MIMSPFDVAKRTLNTSGAFSLAFSGESSAGFAAAAGIVWAGAAAVAGAADSDFPAAFSFLSQAARTKAAAAMRGKRFLFMGPSLLESSGDRQRVLSLAKGQDPALPPRRA